MPEIIGLLKTLENSIKLKAYIYGGIEINIIEKIKIGNNFFLLIKTHIAKNNPINEESIETKAEKDIVLKITINLLLLIIEFNGIISFLKVFIKSNNKGIAIKISIIAIDKINIDFFLIRVIFNLTDI
jgi:hypothetical protein